MREDAEEGVDYGLGRLTWLWRETTVADIRIINDDRQGVSSRRYRPGPSMEIEESVGGVAVWHLDPIRDPAPPACRPGADPDVDPAISPSPR